jgi:hypothetical protein
LPRRPIPQQIRGRAGTPARRDEPSRPYRSPTWAKCTRGRRHFRLRRKRQFAPRWKLEGKESHHSRALFAHVAPAAPTATSVATRWRRRAQGPNVANRKRRSLRTDSDCAGRRGRCGGSPSHCRRSEDSPGPPSVKTSPPTRQRKRRSQRKTHIGALRADRRSPPAISLPRQVGRTPV